MDTYLQEMKNIGFGPYQDSIRMAQYHQPFKTTVKHVKRGSSVLDWGCGEGHFTYFLLSSGFNVTSFSIEDSLFLKDDFKEKWPTSFSYCVNSNPSMLPFDDCSFDAVFSMGVLEHVRETGGSELASLTEIRRILKPGGKFLCFHLPQKYSWIEFASRNLKRTTYCHNYLYTKNDIKKILYSANLRLIEIYPYNFLPRNIITKLPHFIKDSYMFAGAYELLNNTGLVILPVLAQNLSFVAEK